MNSMQSIFSPAITEALGWTIIHALWQGFIILIGLLILLALLNRHSAQVRYFISFTALVIFLGWSVSTFVHAYSYAQEKQMLKSELLSNPNYFKNANQNMGQETTASVMTSNYNIKLVKVRAWFQRNFPLFLSIWLIGIGLFTVRLLGGLAYNRRLRTLQLLPFEEKWMEKLKGFATILNISREVEAYKSPHTTTPLTLGFLKPIILFPVRAFSGLTDKEIEAIIAHELAHIVRNDYLFNIIQSVIEILFFYHPAVWAISKHIRAEREHACDDIAIIITGDQVTYAKALTQAHIFSYQQENLSMAFSKKKGSLLERIKRIQKRRVMKTNISEGLIAACIIISSILLVSFSVGNQYNESIYPVNQNKEAVKEAVTPNPPATPLPPQKAKALKDSILQEVEKNVELAREKEELSEEIERAIEIALSEKDQSLSSEIMQEINLALQEINFEHIQAELKDARIEIDAAISEINSDSIQKEIRAGLKVAREEIRQAIKENKKTMKEIQDMEDVEAITELSLEAAESGLKIAAEVLKNMDIEAIVETSLEAANVAIELAGRQIKNMNLDSLIEAEIEMELKAAEREIEGEELRREREDIVREKEQLKKEMEELKKEMTQRKKELKKELKEMEKEQKD
ncbi:M56 family metallopeptidase [Saccharicrinis sp. 156]|uniref:M56 family metallopeptidase n=1 Tax=Saccharicrinis sp. 156 TaxID=3417574 RepID=UPI003D34F3BE